MAANPNPNATLPRLPNELLDKIAEHLEPPDKVHLCYTNKLLREQRRDTLSYVWRRLSGADRARFLVRLSDTWSGGLEGGQRVVHHHSWPCTIPCMRLHRMTISLGLYDWKVDIQDHNHGCLTVAPFRSLWAELSNAELHLALKYYRLRNTSYVCWSVLSGLLMPRSLFRPSFPNGLEGRMSPKIVDNHYLLRVQWMWKIEPTEPSHNGQPRYARFFTNAWLCPHTTMAVLKGKIYGWWLCNVERGILSNRVISRSGEWRYRENGGVRWEQGRRTDSSCSYCSMDFQILACDTRLLVRTWYNLGSQRRPPFSYTWAAQMLNTVFNPRLDHEGRPIRLTTREMYEWPGLGGNERPASDIHEF